MQYLRTAAWPVPYNGTLRPGSLGADHGLREPGQFVKEREGLDRKDVAKCDKNREQFSDFHCYEEKMKR